VKVVMKLQKSLRILASIAVIGTLTAGSMQSAFAEAVPSVSPAVPVQSVKPVPPSTSVNLPGAKFTADEAIAKLREWFPALQKAQARGTAFRDPKNKLLLSVQWELRDRNSTTGFESSIDLATGDLVQVYFPTDRFGSGEDAYYPPKYTEEEARKLAEKQIRLWMPSMAGVPFAEPEQGQANPVYLNALFSPIRYGLQFVPLVNGIPAPSDAIQVEMDGKGNVRSVRRMYLGGEYPDAQPKLTKEQAAQKFADHADVLLQYMPEYGRDGIVSWYLGYVPKWPMFGRIDAETGEFAPYPYTIDASEYAAVPAKGNAVALRTGQTPMTADEAAALVRQALELDDSYVLQDQTMNERRDGQGGKLWSLTLAQTDENRYNSLHVDVDAVTGQIVQANRSISGTDMPSRGTMPNELTWDSAEAKAMALIQKLYPNAVKELKLIKLSDPQKQGMFHTFQFTFQRFIGDIPVSGNTAVIYMDSQGNLTSYYAGGTRLDEQTALQLKPAIGKDEAIRKLLEHAEVKLQYARFDEPDATTYYGITRTAPIKLVYVQSFKNPGSLTVVDASSGKLHPLGDSYLIPSEQQQTAEPNDISGHAAEEALNVAVAYGILQPDEEGNVHPDEAITVYEWLQMAGRAVDRNYERNYYGMENRVYFADVKEDSPYAHTVFFATMQGWLDPAPDRKLEAEKSLTRDAFAASLMQIVKYDKLAELLNDRSTSAFKDADQIAHKGAAALAVQLGLIDAQDGLFRPDQPVTRADAAQALIAIAKILGKLDQPVSPYYY